MKKLNNIPLTYLQKKEIKELFLVHQYDKYTCVNGMAVFPFFHVSE